MKVRDIVSVIEDFAPLSAQESWDNCGLQIGSPEDEVRGVMVGFDCTAELIDEAVAEGCNMVITHHPLIFKGLKNISGEDPVSAAVVRAIRQGVAVYCSHTASDKVVGGVSFAMADRLGLQNQTILDDEGGVGLGVVGTLQEPLDAPSVIAKLKEVFQINTVRTSRPISLPISKIAVCGGAGASLIETARLSGAQLYVSGDISYHNFFTFGDFMIADVGHFESEVQIVDTLFTILKEKFPNFAVRVFGNIREKNPVFYF